MRMMNLMNCKQKQIKLIQAFQACSNSRESIYHKIIELGQTLPLFKEEWKREENLVRGCQS
ncbi:MAG: SufE family protein, partial [Simkania sp.]|nr:SufE family protein [Simkania sp.]